jgi:hypothetical protein
VDVVQGGSALPLEAVAATAAAGLGTPGGGAKAAAGGGGGGGAVSPRARHPPVRDRSYGSDELLQRRADEEVPV